MTAEGSKSRLEDFATRENARMSTADISIILGAKAVVQRKGGEVRGTLTWLKREMLWGPKFYDDMATPRNKELRALLRSPSSLRKTLVRLREQLREAGVVMAIEKPYGLREKYYVRMSLASLTDDPGRRRA